jgi:hypothetical protein
MAFQLGPKNSCIFKKFKRFLTSGILSAKECKNGDFDPKSLVIGAKAT